MSFRQRALARLDELGGTFDERYDTVDAPPGFVFGCAPDLHGLALPFGDMGCTAESVWRDLLDRLTYGVQPCERPDCDVCGEDPGVSGG